MKNGVIYRGPSLIDGAPIVVVALWSKANRKTGGMLQTYVIRDDMDPLKASKTGADRAICGDCPHRGNATTDPARSCGCMACSRKTGPRWAVGASSGSGPTATRAPCRRMCGNSCFPKRPAGPHTRIKAVGALIWPCNPPIPMIRRRGSGPKGNAPSALWPAPTKLT